jgi:hypothetical protein
MIVDFVYQLDNFHLFQLYRRPSSIVNGRWGNSGGSHQMRKICPEFILFCYETHNSVRGLLEYLASLATLSHWFLGSPLEGKLPIAHDFAAINFDGATAGDHINMDFRPPVGSGKFGIGVAEGDM